jgi:hypothetical protein
MLTSNNSLTGRHQSKQQRNQSSKKDRSISFSLISDESTRRGVACSKPRKVAVRI